MNRKASSMSTLPEEVVDNILSRLPVKSLGRCKCVSKSWRSQISNPQSVKFHLNRAVSDAKTNPFRLFTTYPFHALDYESPSSFEDVADDDDAIVDLGFPSGEPANGVEIMGSCNGLLCLLYFPDCFILWNPTIKDSRELPTSPTSSDGDLSLKGFGYVPSMDDYKVVRAIQTRVEVFSLKDDSWRRIEDLHTSIVIEEEVGTFLNGSLHWLASHHKGPTKQHVILSLDLEREKFSEISLPDVGKTFHTLAMFNGCLSLLSNEGYGNLWVWVMKAYGVNASWTKQVSLLQDDFLFCDYLVPVCSTKNGEIIIDIDGMQIIRYNLEERTVRNLKNRSEQYFEWLLYVETLVSPNTYQGFIST
ncbi:F-box/kelch-repeat protein [Actinidia chinensis var. chinensis]|uniref:F-box/kelch-repeat protein n=1 Tax=Actinidia chinensis var. chinensis TaxID=1590841 RepID=A0A2R6S0V8_ACTCC|nr:F-box/kelch-repeat protein [Actinidia chinensis var. chinensis]